MSTHSIIEHRANYHYVKLQEDYLAICSHGTQSPHCKALILSILEHWTNTKRACGESEYIYMTIPQWIQYTYMLYERNVITDCIAELLEEGLIARRPLIMYGQNTFEYCLNVEFIQIRIRRLAQKGIDECLPNLDGYLAYKIAAKERRIAAKEGVGEKSRTTSKVREKSRTTSKVREKSRRVGDKSPTVREKSRRGYVINQRNLYSNTNINLDSPDIPSVAHATENAETTNGHAKTDSTSSSSPDAAYHHSVDAHPQHDTDMDTVRPVLSDDVLRGQVSTTGEIVERQQTPTLGTVPPCTDETALASPPIASVPSASDVERPQPAMSARAIAKQVKLRQEEIIALACEITGRPIMRSKPNMDGALGLAQNGALDEDIAIVWRRIKQDTFYAKQMTLLTVFNQFDSRLDEEKLAQQAQAPTPPVPIAIAAQRPGVNYSSFTDPNYNPDDFEKEFYHWQDAPWHKDKAVL